MSVLLQLARSEEDSTSKKQRSSALIIIEEAAKGKDSAEDSFFLSRNSSHDNGTFALYFCASDRKVLHIMLAALVRLSRKVSQQYCHLYMRHGQDVDFKEVDAWCTGEIIQALIHPRCNERVEVPAHVLVMDSSRPALLRVPARDNSQTLFAKRMGIYDEQKTRLLNDPSIVATHFSPGSRYSTIVVPLHSVKKAHWSLVVFQLARRSTFDGGGGEAIWNSYHLDSLYPLALETAESFVRRMAREMQRVDGRVRFENVLQRSMSRRFVHELRVSSQGDGWSCGYHTVLSMRRLLYECDGCIDKLRQSMREQPNDHERVARMLARSAQQFSQWNGCIVASEACDNIINYEWSAKLTLAESKKQRRATLSELRKAASTT